MKTELRLQRILEILLEKDDYITIARIATTLELSPRTISSALTRLEPLLKELHLEMETRAGRGVRISSPAAQKMAAQLQLKQQLLPKQRRFGLSPEKRQEWILLQLLCGKEALHTRNLEKELHVSRATAFHDVHAVEKRLAKYRLRLIRHKNSGLAVEGNERRIRTCLVDTFLNMDDFQVFKKMLNGEAQKKESIFPPLNLSRFFVQRLAAYLKKKEFPVRQQISNHYKAAILLRYYVAVYRYQQGHAVQLSEELLAELRRLHPLKETEALLLPFEEEVGVELSEVEKRYLQVFLLAADGSYVVSGQELEEARGFTAHLTRQWTEKLKFDLERDFIFREDLFLAVTGLQARMMFGIHAEFLYAKEMLRKYPSLEPLISHEIRDWEKKYGFQCGESETGYLMLVLLAALKRKTEHLKLLLFCQSEAAATRLLEEELERHLAEVELSLENRLQNLRQEKLADYDLLLICSPIPLKVPIPTLYLQAILTVKEIGRIQETVSQLREEKISLIIAAMRHL